MDRYDGRWQCWGRTHEQLRIARAILKHGLPYTCQFPQQIAREAGVNRMRVRHILHHMRKQEILVPLMGTHHGAETERVYLSNRATVYVPGPRWWEWVAHTGVRLREMSMEGFEDDAAAASG